MQVCHLVALTDFFVLLHVVFYISSPHLTGIFGNCYCQKAWVAVKWSNSYFIQQNNEWQNSKRGFPPTEKYFTHKSHGGLSQCLWVSHWTAPCSVHCRHKFPPTAYFANKAEFEYMTVWFLYLSSSTIGGKCRIFAKTRIVKSSILW